MSPPVERTNRISSHKFKLQNSPTMFRRLIFEDTATLFTLVAFITAVVAVRWLVSFLHTHPLSIFGWYRIGIAVTVAGLIGIGAI